MGDGAISDHSSQKMQAAQRRSEQGWAKKLQLGRHQRMFGKVMMYQMV